MNELKTIINAIKDKLGENIVVLYIKKVSTISEYFIIASADNERKVSAIAKNVEDEMKNISHFASSKEGYDTQKWIVLDYGECIVHIFKNEERDFYDLERLWKDAPYIDIDTILA
ncbi:ribosome silencing factor [Filifactor alocis]|uniref:ribosome silencing factor n=1 Tax=Filifactor alocis TaxID=143361 RepID=UPI003C703CA3